MLAISVIRKVGKANEVSFVFFAGQMRDTKLGFWVLGKNGHELR